MKTVWTIFALAAAGVVGCSGAAGEAIDETTEGLTTSSARVTCQSLGYHYASCNVNTDGGRIVEMRVVRQLSHSPGDCTEGTSFGYGDDYVWVDHGCRADFEVRIRRWGGGGWGSINVVSATYGGNAGASWGNATNNVSYRCNGQSTCDYLVSVNELGDPAYGRRKDFSVDWNCGGGETKHAHIDAEANGVHVYLTCN